MRERNIQSIATNDEGFLRVDALNVYRPGDLWMILFKRKNHCLRRWIIFKNAGNVNPLPITGNVNRKSLTFDKRKFPSWSFLKNTHQPLPNYHFFRIGSFFQFQQQDFMGSACGDRIELLHFNFALFTGFGFLSPELRIVAQSNNPCQLYVMDDWVYDREKENQRCDCNGIRSRNTRCLQYIKLELLGSILF